MAMFTPIRRNFAATIRTEIFKPSGGKMSTDRKTSGHTHTLRAGIAAAPIAFLLVGGAAQAQDIDPRTPLENRARPDFGSPPLTVGAFEIRPQIDAGVEYVDNLFASDLFDVNDVVVSIRPNVSITDNRQDREIRLNLSTGYQTFLNNNSGDLFQLQGRLNARVGKGTPTRIFGGAEFRLNDATQVDFSSAGNVAQPLETTSYGGNLGIEQDLGSFTLQGEGRYSRFVYQGLIFFGNAAIEGSLRDYAFYQGRARLSYSRRPDQRLYVEGRYGRFEFDNGGLQQFPGLPDFFLADRSGDTISAAGGLQIQVTEVLSLDANLGYTRLLFDDPTVESVNAFSAEANVYYAPTRLTRFQLQATRAIDESINPLFSSFLRTGGAFVAEHELRRNVLLRGEARYVRFDTGDAGLAGDELQLGGSVIYFVSPRISLRIRGEYFDRSGFAAGQQQRVSASIGYRF